MANYGAENSAGTAWMRNIVIKPVTSWQFTTLPKTINGIHFSIAQTVCKWEFLLLAIT